MTCAMLKTDTTFNSSPAIKKSVPLHGSLPALFLAEPRLRAHRRQNDECKKAWPHGDPPPFRRGTQLKRT